MKQMQRFFVILAGIVCFSGICLADKSGSLVVSPGSDVSWGCALKPYETATLTITVAAPPPGYRLKNQTVTITSSSPDFCWGGGYSVVNSAGISASTRVTVRCVWEPIPGEGGGPGTPPPNLYGSATGIASAQPGEYWNVADAHVVAVGESVGVNAYKNDNEPAPSAWSISGPATIAGAGASATVVGTAPSASEFDVIVHSVCNETGQTDDELLTVVGVESITAEPEVVCVDAEVSYTITTQPEGYNYMVSYTPADTSTPGIKEVIATCGSSSATCTVTVVKVEMDHDLWWFGDKDAANYDESATLTANGTTVGTFNWQVVQGGTRIVLNNGGDDSWGITANNDNTIVVKSTGRSASPLDAKIRLNLNGIFVCDYNLSVYSPMTVQRMSGPVDEPYEIIGFKTVYTFKVLNNFGHLLPKEIEVNEQFGPWVSDWTIANGRPTDENWPEPTPNGHFTGSETPIHFTETYAYATFLRTPGTVNPGATHAEESVQHALQTYQAGSLTPGDGVMIKSHTLQHYRGQGRQ